MGRFDLTDRQWQRLEPLLPPQRPRTGRPNDDHRRIVNGILWVLRTGAPWRDLPERYGPVGTVSSRFYRWREAGVWDRALAALQAEADARGEVDWDLHFVDATIVRAHQHAAGARRTGAVGGCGPGRGPGPFPGRVLDQGPPARRGRRQADHLRPDRGRAAREPDAPGAALARRGAPPGRGRPRLRPRRVAGDKAYTGRPVRSFLRRRGIGAVIPTQKGEPRRLASTGRPTASATGSSG
jgi:transposase